METIGIGIDYSNICKDYNTAYLDRDNKDPATVQCMRKILAWLDELLGEVIEKFDFKVYRPNNKPEVPLNELVSKRFLFYSLGKEITLQTYILHNENTYYATLPQWADESKESLLIQNVDEGEGIHFFMPKDSKIHQWLLERLKGFSLDEIPFSEK